MNSCFLMGTMHACMYHMTSPVCNCALYGFYCVADDKSELGMEELMGEAYTLRAIHNKV